MARKVKRKKALTNAEKTLKKIQRFYKKPKDYEGGISLLADAGNIVPRTYRDTAVDCECIWASPQRLDVNGRPRQDVAFGVAVGEIDGIIRVEAGEERIPIYNYLDLDEIITGQRYFKSIEVYVGASDQDQSPTIVRDLGDAEAPYYRGLAYFVLRGFKLWRWPNKAVPVLRAVILRNVAEYTGDPEDRYVEEEFPSTYTLIANNMAQIGTDQTLYFHYTVTNNNVVRTLDMDTDTVGSLPTTTTVVPVSTDALAEFSDGAGGTTIYQAKDDGLRKWNGVSWDVIVDTSVGNKRIRQLIVSPDKNWMLYTYNYTFGGNTELWKFDGTTHSLIGDVTDWFGNNNTGLRWKQFKDNQTIYLMNANTIIEGNINGGLWTARHSSGGTPYDNASSVYFDNRLWYLIKSGSDTFMVEYDDSSLPHTSTLHTVHAGAFANSYDLEVFKDKLHLVFRLPTGDADKYVRRWTGSAFESLAYPSGFNSSNLWKLSKTFRGGVDVLLVGSANGIFSQGDTVL